MMEPASDADPSPVGGCGGRSPPHRGARGVAPPKNIAGHRKDAKASTTVARLVELRGFEPLTPSMRTRCATGLRYSPNNAVRLANIGPCLAHPDGGSVA